MAQRQSISNQRIIECLHDDYGITVTTLTPMLLGADKDASTYKAKTADHTSYFVKVRHGHHQDTSSDIQLFLHNAGIQQIISPIKTVHGQIAHHIDNSTLIVYPFIEGRDGFHQELTDNQWVTFGKMMKQVHELQLPKALKSTIKHETYSPQWRNAVRSIYTDIDTHNTVKDEVAVQLLAYMQKYRSTIEHLVQHAEQLADELKQQSLEFVLCHSDIHGGNVLIANDKNIYIVDWDQPIMAAKERDLMFIGAGVANVWNNSHETTLFYQGYGNTNINKDALSYYRCERIVEDVAEYCQQLLLTTDGSPTDRKTLYTHFADMFKPKGVIDIALKHE